MSLDLSSYAIDIGTTPGDGTGDPARTCFDLINQMRAAIQAYINAFPTAYHAQNLQTGTTYTLVLGDAGKIVEMNNASANTLTIPANASVAFPVNTRIDVVQYGAGQTTIAIMSDTLRGEVNVGGQYNAVSLWKRAATEWIVFGGVA